MGNILLDNQKTDIRYSDKEIVIYEPTDIQREEIINSILGENVQVGEDLSMQGEVSFRNIRTIIRECTSIGASIDEMTDEEVETLLNNGNRRIKILFREITNLLEELSEDIQWKYEQEIRVANTFLNIANSKDSADKVKVKMEKLMKKNGIDISLEELANAQKNPEDMNKIMNKIKVSPQDRKKKQTK